MHCYRGLRFANPEARFKKFMELFGASRIVRRLCSLYRNSTEQNSIDFKPPIPIAFLSYPDICERSPPQQWVDASRESHVGYFLSVLIDHSLRHGPLLLGYIRERRKLALKRTPSICHCRHGNAIDHSVRNN
jgi:hypothetical protein